MQTTQSSDSAKKTAKPRAKTAKKKTLHLKAPHVAAPPPPDKLVDMIATAAYYCAEQRHFVPGYELEDWLTAERQIKAMYS